MNKEKISKINKVKMAIGGIAILVLGYKLGTNIAIWKIEIGLNKLMVENPELKTSMQNALSKKLFKD